LGIKRPGCQSDHSPPSSAEVKNALSCTTTPPYVFIWRAAKVSRGTTFPHLSTTCKVSCKRKIPRYPLGRTLWGLQSRCGRWGGGGESEVPSPAGNQTRKNLGLATFLSYPGSLHKEKSANRETRPTLTAVGSVSLPCCATAQWSQ
jgi:hypothetical protein